MRQCGKAAEGRRTGRDRVRTAFGLLIAILGMMLHLVLPLQAQPHASAPTFYSRQREFRIPFTIDPSERRISMVRLHVSDNQGQSWQVVASTQPGASERFFTFKAERDGWYWFSVQTIDHERRAYPAFMDSRAPIGLKVAIDTREPRVNLQALPAAEGNVGISWVVEDENLNNLQQNKPDTLILEYRAAGTNVPWTRRSAEQKAVGQRIWNPETNAPLDVRLRVFDDAGNEGQSNPVTVSAGGSGRPAATGREGAEAVPSARTSSDGRRLVNSKRINLNYDVQEVGKSGLSVIELWTTDGTVWKREGSKSDPQPPYVYSVELDHEGIYGFTLVARSGVGLGEQPPKVGDLPQIWVEADWTKPHVVLQGVEVGQGADTGSLFVTYTAEDKNLDREGSITLSYAERLEGPWTAFARNHDNTGRFVWRMPSSVPFQFYVRVEATDRAGNVGSAETNEPVKVDLNRPRTRVLTVEPASK